MVLEELRNAQTVDELTFKGTITVGAVTEDGVTSASDNRVTMGSLIVHKKGKKVYNIDGHPAMAFLGVVADIQQVTKKGEPRQK